MKFFAKTAFVSAVFFLTAPAAFAQIILDLDVLEDTLPPLKKEAPPSNEAKKNKSVPLTAPTVKTEKPAAPVPLKPEKPVVKKPTPPQKPEKKAPPAPVKKYQVKENAVKDEHDKLKPHAAPVPVVKVLAFDQGEKTEEKTPETVKPDVRKEPKLSKHFLEQQNKPEKTSEKKKPVPQQITKTEPVVAKQKPAEPEKVQTPEPIVEPEKPAVSPVPTPAPEIAEAPSEPAPVKEEPEKRAAIYNFSVFPVSSKLTPEERSDILVKEIPQQSATFKALNKRKLLAHLFIFDKKSLELTDEMQNALNALAVLMKNDGNKKLILYSYASSDPLEPGKERQYTLRRALMIRSYLTTQGVHSLRVELRAQGQKGAGDKIPDRTDLVIYDKP